MASENTAGEERGAPTFIVEVVVALLVLALGVTILAGSWHLGSGWTTDGPGPGYFPFYIGLIMCISAVGIIVQAVRKHDVGVFVSREQLKQVLIVLIPAIFYVGFVQLAGLYVASAVYIAAFMIVLGKFSPVKSIVAALLIMGLFFAMFEVWFKVPLFKGAFNLLQFTGY
jgi:hypothetical protein